MYLCMCMLHCVVCVNYKYYSITIPGIYQSINQVIHVTWNYNSNTVISCMLCYHTTAQELYMSGISSVFYVCSYMLSILYIGKLSKSIIFLPLAQREEATWGLRVKSWFMNYKICGLTDPTSLDVDANQGNTWPYNYTLVKIH